MPARYSRASVRWCAHHFKRPLAKILFQKSSSEILVSSTHQTSHSPSTYAHHISLHTDQVHPEAHHPNY